MPPLLSVYRNAALDGILEVLWRQWTALGVPGYGKPIYGRILDPETLLAFTCALGRYDARLFDEVLVWLKANGRYINTQRLRTVFRNGAFTGAPVARAIAHKLRQPPSPLFWELGKEGLRSPAAQEPLFYTKDGLPLSVPSEPDAWFQMHGYVRNPIELRSFARPFPTTGSAALILRLRALLGVSARCETLVYLLTHPAGYPNEIARDAHYFHKTIYDALADMETSGYIVSLRFGRQREYRLTSEALREALIGKNDTAVWTDWATLFGAIEHFWLGITMLLEKQESDSLLQASELRKCAKPLVRALYGQQSLPVIAESQSNDLADCIAPLMEVIDALRQ